MMPADELIPGDVVRLPSGRLAEIRRWAMCDGETVAECRYRNGDRADVTLSLAALARARLVVRSPLPC